MTGYKHHPGRYLAEATLTDGRTRRWRLARCGLALLALAWLSFACGGPDGGSGGGIDIGNAEVAVAVKEIRTIDLSAALEEIAARASANPEYTPQGNIAPVTKAVEPENGFVPTGIEMGLSEVMYLAGDDCAEDVPDASVGEPVSSAVLFPGLGGPLPPLQAMKFETSWLCGIALRFTTGDQFDAIGIKAEGRGEYEGQRGRLYLHEPIELLYEFAVPISVDSGDSLLFQFLIEPRGWLNGFVEWGISYQDELYWSGDSAVGVQRLLENIGDSTVVRLLDENRATLGFAQRVETGLAHERIERVRRVLALE